ncbi:MAG: FAD/NAD(P)-binding protein [Spirochaetales bacterium]|nr:FAD/NAD(P)-binding protein [Spirochaetales bacterium]MCP5484354.1 FAD/NAD(P)-binding protein [Spirochaetales bacterium]
MVQRQVKTEKGAMSVASPWQPVPYRIDRVIGETHNIFTFELSPVGKEPIPAFEPGQFNMLYVFGVGEVAISVSGDSAVRDRLVHTIRAMGSVTRTMQRFKTGQIIGVRGPFGKGWPLQAARDKDLVIVAGGVGLAPLRPVLYYARRNRDQFRRISLLYGARAPMDVLYAEELSELRSQFDWNVEVTVDTADAAWRGHVGLVTRLIDRIPFEAENTVAMLCGPEIMMRLTGDALTDRGVTPENVYVSMERNMKCAIGFCGHCQYGPQFICRDGPVFARSVIGDAMLIREI